MREQIEILIKLQNIETEIGNTKVFLNSLSEKFKTLDARRNDFDQLIAEETSRLEKLKRKYRECESEVQINLAKIKKSQEKSGSIKTNKDYQAALKEIEELKKKNSQLQDGMVEDLDRIEKSEKSLAEKKAEFLRVTRQITDEKEAIQLEADQKKETLDRFDKDWTAISKTVRPDMMKKFLMVKGKGGGIAVVAVKEAVCQGCNMNIPPQLYNELQRLDSLKFCPHCQRLIYWEKRENEE
ncbi:MAG: hypothetical protein BWK80_33695 [Desulfobacteraceae bacterium IS3]|nr:MAG: hypothetical protein BWK80_33695 [Desulfobacteraceae bacterium IS3]